MNFTKFALTPLSCVAVTVPIVFIGVPSLMSRFAPQRLQNILRWLASIIPWRIALKEEEERRQALSGEELKKIRGELDRSPGNTHARAERRASIPDQGRLAQHSSPTPLISTEARQTRKR
ncbi:hypothetical protein BV22DRAFT_1029354 [Leucogyrophana mollusca]|uniref:Uncharacterized protein n=1 Tax=Leucogyrophana mollusca TaxID=85980 RepID=A0ACB8BXY0_9AGAM|nr:hypothetical protein BV22DRAFT_1029354 [Leucogyrophana mollusca]